MMNSGQAWVYFSVMSRHVTSASVILMSRITTGLRWVMWMWICSGQVPNMVFFRINAFRSYRGCKSCFLLIGSVSRQRLVQVNFSVEVLHRPPNTIFFLTQALSQGSPSSLVCILDCSKSNLGDPMSLLTQCSLAVCLSETCEFHAFRRHSWFV